MDFPSFCFNTIKTTINGLRYHYKAACAQGSDNFLSCFRRLGDKFRILIEKLPLKARDWLEKGCGTHATVTCGGDVRYFSESRFLMAVFMGKL
ncbi:MAG: hypothetical protein O9274_10905 [Limnobacter sp.]|uniref:hypothetical protein n=1 Tax=Limnobacter sp. TaxID=2003368 RepID=UPI0022C1860B|nr:hypothetical protein [Limnobacter sp.]MCZ8016198.1 hypothetical protein [Limnobacter sp.]